MINWIDFALRFLPVVIGIIQQVHAMLDQMEDERRKEIDLQPVRDKLHDLRGPVVRLAQRLNGHAERYET